MKPWERYQQQSTQTGPWSAYQSPYNYSATDKAKYATRAAIEGAAFGLGDMIAGGTNVLAGRAAQFLNPETVPQKSIAELFSEGRKDFVNEQQAFAAEHPGLNMVGEIAGGAVTAAIPIGAATQGARAASLGAKVAAGAKTGTAFGAAYGAGSGLTNNADSLNPLGAVQGAVIGGVIGAPIGAGTAMAGAGINAGIRGLRNAGNRLIGGNGEVTNTANLLSRRIDNSAIDNIAGNQHVRQQVAKGNIGARMNEFEENAINALRLTQDEIPRIESSFYKQAGVTDNTPINLLENNGGASYLRQLYSKISEFNKQAIGNEEKRIGRNLLNIFNDIRQQSNNGKITFGQSKILSSKMFDAAQRDTLPQSAKNLYRDLGGIMREAKNSIPAIREASGKFSDLRQAREAVEELLKTDRLAGEIGLANKIFRNAKEAGHQAFNQRLNQADAVIRNYGGTGFGNEIKMLQTAHLLDKARQTVPTKGGLFGLPVIRNIRNTLSLSPESKAQLLAQGIDRRIIKPENVLGQTEISTIPVIGNSITRSRAYLNALGLRPAATPNINIYGNELGRRAYQNPKQMRKQAVRMYQNKLQQGIVDRNNMQGISFGNHGIHEVKQTSADTRKLNTIPHIPAIIKNGTLGPKRPLYKTRNDAYETYQYIETPINYQGKPETAVISIANERGKGPVFNNINLGKKNGPAGRSTTKAVPAGPIHSIPLQSTEFKPLALAERLLNYSPYGAIGPTSTGLAEALLNYGGIPTNETALKLLKYKPKEKK